MLEKLKEILERVMPGVDARNISLETRLIEDLNFDSLALMMMAMEIEDTFNFRFEDMVKFETVGDACSYLENIAK